MALKTILTSYQISLDTWVPFTMHVQMEDYDEIKLGTDRVVGDVHRSMRYCQHSSEFWLWLHNLGLRHVNCSSFFERRHLKYVICGQLAEVSTAAQSGLT